MTDVEIHVKRRPDWVTDQCIQNFIDRYNNEERFREAFRDKTLVYSEDGKLKILKQHETQAYENRFKDTLIIVFYIKRVLRYGYCVAGK